MFSGIIEGKGIVKQRESTAMIIEAGDTLQGVAVKDSIAVDGSCLTVTARGENWFRVDTMPETLRCTRLGTLQPGAQVNLERSLAADGRIGGHMVQGHIETTVTVLSTRQDGIGCLVDIELPPHMRSYIISKGFVALNGVSLTVVDVQQDRFSVALIPYTREHTNLGEASPGMLLNLESDILGRYVVQFLTQRDASRQP